MRDRAKSRIREAIAITAAVGGAALGVGAAVAATSPSLVSAPESANAPATARGELSPLPAQVKGYTILRPSSLVMDTPAGLRILYGTGLAVTGHFDIAEFIEQARARGERSPAPAAQAHASPASPVAAPAPSGEPATVFTEPDFPGQGEEHRSETADPKRSDRAEAQAAELSDVPRQDDRAANRDR